MKVEFILHKTKETSLKSNVIKCNVKVLCELCSSESGHFYLLMAGKLTRHLVVSDYVVDSIMYPL